EPTLPAGKRDGAVARAACAQSRDALRVLSIVEHSRMPNRMLFRRRRRGSAAGSARRSAAGKRLPRPTIRTVPRTRGGGGVAFLPTELGAKPPLRLVLIGAAASQSDALDGSFPAPGHGPDVVVLEQSAGRATPALFAHERALAAIALPDGRSHLGRDAAVLDRSRPGSARGGTGGELLLFRLLDQSVEGAVEDHTGIARGKRMTQQVPGVGQLVL